MRGGGGGGFRDGSVGETSRVFVRLVAMRTPKPIQAEGSFGIFKEREVNIVIHGHEPLMAEMIYDVVSEPEMIAYASDEAAGDVLQCQC